MTVAFPLLFLLAIVDAATLLPSEVVFEMQSAFYRFDHNGDGVVRWQELAVGLLSSSETPPEAPYYEHVFGLAQCADPTLDALSFMECEIAKARNATDKFEAVIFETELSRFVAGCREPTQAWQTNRCMGSCSDCFHQSANLDLAGSEGRHIDVAVQTNGTKILISSDWHIEPWYLSTAVPFACGGPTSMTCRFPGADLDNMFSCRDQNGHNTTCTLDALKDPPISMEQSHVASAAAAEAKVHFFVGDTQVHSFSGNWSQPAAVTKLLDKVLDEELARFGAANIVWTPGNNDGPHSAIFQTQDPSTVAWANALLSRGIVSDDLGIVYAGGVNQTSRFRQTGFYCKALPAISLAAYAVVLNTNLGGSNELQNQTLSATLEWISAKHSGAAVVYLLGHHPAVMKSGVNLVPSQYVSMIKGVFAGHVHYATSTTAELFTQVPAITLGALNVAYWVASVSESAPEVRLTTSQLYRYTGTRGKLADPAMWRSANAQDESVVAQSFSHASYVV